MSRSWFRTRCVSIGLCLRCHRRIAMDPRPMALNLASVAPMCRLAWSSSQQIVHGGHGTQRDQYEQPSGITVEGINNDHHDSDV